MGQMKVVKERRGMEGKDVPLWLLELQLRETQQAFATNPDYRAVSVEVDVTTVESGDAIVATELREFVRIDYSANSAGISARLGRDSPSFPSYRITTGLLRAELAPKAR